ncbi:hypothetical protein K435DRAFT_180569 [Dendrothele bispora CBS 962.96]|uniref:Uncharacterized protein n=1 Tax=Dendrothele bispora (strain CBS 962.96) TaxID=1314807 RepID=A0A4S8KL50_DENBC|nr:hypothetical protein K435DRAFT_180569 [Dendrothele bispora CBS 962.96]
MVSSRTRNDMTRNDTTTIDSSLDFAYARPFKKAVSPSTRYPCVCACCFSVILTVKYVHGYSNLDKSHTLHHQLRPNFPRFDIEKKKKGLMGSVFWAAEILSCRIEYPIDFYLRGGAWFGPISEGRGVRIIHPFFAFRFSLLTLAFGYQLSFEPFLWSSRVWGVCVGHCRVLLK